MGKISSKELIAEIIAYACGNKKLLYMVLFYTSKQLRVLLTEGSNFIWISRLQKSPIEYVIKLSRCKIGYKEAKYIESLLQDDLSSVELLYQGSKDGWWDTNFH